MTREQNDKKIQNVVDQADQQDYMQEKREDRARDMMQEMNREIDEYEFDHIPGSCDDPTCEMCREYRAFKRATPSERDAVINPRPPTSY